MIRKCFLAFSLIASLTMAGQTKQLTLEQSTLQQFRQFRADGLLDTKWLPSGNSYSYLNATAQELTIATPSGAKTTIQTSEIKGTQFPHFFGITWMDDKNFASIVGTQWVQVNIDTKTAKVIGQLSEEAENITPDQSQKWVAYTKANNLYLFNGTEKAVTNNTDKNIVSGQAYARSEFGIRNGIFFSPKSTYLAYYQKDETQVADYPILDITTTPGSLRSIKYPMAGQPSEQPKVGIYNLATGKTVFISPRADKEDYLTNLSWTPDEKHLLIAEVNRDQNKMNLNLYEAATGNFVRTLITEESKDWVEPENPAYFVGDNSKQFVWISERNGFNNLYLYDLNGKLIRQLTNNQFVTREIVGHNTAATEVYTKATGANPTNMLYYRVSLKGKQSLLTPIEGTHNLAINPQGTAYIDSYSNLTTPGVTALYNVKGKATELVNSPNKLADYQIGSTEIKTIKSQDGKTDLYTRIIKPSNFDTSKKYPVMVYVYGGPHAQMITNSYLGGANLWMHWMAEQGYIVFTLDNRGSDNRGVAFEKVIHRDLGTNEMLDQLAGLDYLKSLPYVDAERVAVHGWSYGGFMTTSLMLRHPGAFNVGVAGGPVTDWKFYEIMYGERYMDRPEQNVEGYKKSSTLNYVKDLEGKLLLIHGTADDVVVLQHNYALVKAFVEAGKQVDYFPYPMHLHNVTGKDRVHLIEKILTYILENNN